MLKDKLITILIPAFNEEKNIALVIKDTLKLSKKYPLEVIVVDDGSTDKTAIVAKVSGATKVISHKKNMGKGAAVKTGINHAQGDFIIQIDSDYQFKPSEIPNFIQALNAGANIVVGSRFKGNQIAKGSIKLTHIFGNAFLSLVTSVASGIKVTDIMAGFKGFQTKSAKKLDLQTNHFGYEAEIIVKAKKLNLKVSEIPISYSKRKFGHSAVNTIRDGFKVIFTIIKSH